MAYSAIPKSTSYFNSKLYTGNGSTNAITGVGFQPDWVWIKDRGDTHDHNAYDAVRGVTKMITPNENYAESTVSASLTSFDSDGFTLGNVARSNANGGSLVSWNWKANGTGSSNTDGDITSTVSTNTTSGFSIVKYTGNGSTNQTVGHGLGSVPKLIINKQLTTQNWFVYHHSIGNTDVLKLNTTDAKTTSSAWNNTTPTSSVFTIGTSSSTNVSGEDFINYCFAEKTGFSKFGSYVGNANADGTFIYTGFKPSFIMIKRTDTTGDWLMKDNKRPTVQNPVTSLLYPNQSYAEATGVNDADFISTGYKIRTTGTAENASGGTYIYMAFGQPIVSTNNVIATAR